MKQRFTTFLALAGFAGLGMGGALLVPGEAATSGRIPFQIVTGAPSGTFFPVGEAIAGLLSHPPNLGRCNVAPVCGPAGLIISARSSAGAVDNVNLVNSGGADFGLSNADVVAAAVKGQMPFRAKATHLRVLASLYDEDVHLVVSAKSNVRNVIGLRGKRVARNVLSGSGLTMREVLGAYGVAEKSLKLVPIAGSSEVALMKAGKLDAFFIVGGAPLGSLTELFASGQVRLVPIDGKGRDRLVRMVPSLAPASIAANAYGNKSEIPTVATRALWIVHEKVPDALVYGLTKALLHPFNRHALVTSHPSAGEIRLSDAARNLPAPLHPGAAQFYKAALK